MTGSMVRISSIDLEMSSCFKDEINGGLCGKPMSSSKKTLCSFFLGAFYRKEVVSFGHPILPTRKVAN